MRRASCVVLLLALAGPAAAQVDPSGHWRTLHTQHFRVHFRPAYRDKAREIAAEAERAYGLLSRELHPPRGVIDLTVSDDMDTPNGFTTTYPSNRFTILLTPPVTDPGLQNFDSWNRLVVVHELTHVFHLDRSRGLWGALQAVFGRAPGLFPNQYQPSWVTEGIATYYESRFTAGGRADGSFHRQVVAADAAAGAARSPWDALLFTRWPDGLAPYAYGSRFFEYLSQTAGDSVVPRMVEGTAGQVIPFRVGRPLRRAGANLDESWRGAIATAGATQLATRSTLIAGRLRTEPVPRVSPAGRGGRLVAYVHSDGRGAQRLRVVDLESGRVLRSHRVTGQVGFDWQADTLIVAQLDFTSRWRIRSDLWRWAPDGAWTRMTRNARLIEPRAGGGVTSVLELGRGQSVARTSAMPRMDSSAIWGPAVPSPDGRVVVAARHRNGRWQLVRWRAGAPESLTLLVGAQAGSTIADPVWTPDGAAILFVTEVNGLPQIHRWQEGQGLEQVTAEPRGARAPAALRNGRILFATLGDGGWELRSIEPVAIRSPVVGRLGEPAFTAAPPVAARETGYASWGSLRPHFWIPFALPAEDAGTFFGGVTAGVDAVGRDAYFVLAAYAPSTRRARGSATVVTHRLGSPTLAFSASSDWDQIGSSLGRSILRNEIDGAAGAEFITQRWRVLASLRVAAEYEGERFALEPDTTVTAVCALCLPSDLVGGSVGVSFAHAVTAPLAVSLQDGIGLRLLYRRREQQGTARWSDEIRGRMTLYARAGPRVGFAYPVLAVRVAAGAINGTLAERLSVGGVSSGTLPIGVGIGLGSTRTFPVRGYRADALLGRRVATVSLEYRVPLALVGRSLGHLPLGADKVAFTVFGDLGDAWDPGEPARLHRLRSVGAELVGDLTLSYDFPLRVRIGVAQPAAGQAKLYAAFGADF